MSKSLGNLVLVRNLLKTIEPDHLRLYLISTHYREDANYQEGQIAAMHELYQKFKDACAQANDLPASMIVREEFETAMQDDLDTPRALMTLSRTADRILSGNHGPGESEALREALEILGFAFAKARGPANNDFSP